MSFRRAPQSEVPKAHFPPFLAGEFLYLTVDFKYGKGIPFDFDTHFNQILTFTYTKIVIRGSSNDNVGVVHDCST